MIVITKERLRAALRRVRMGLNRMIYGVRNVHRTTYLAMGSHISSDLNMGCYGYVGPGAQICPKVKMGNYVMFGSQVMIVGHDHVYDVVGTPIIFSGRPEHSETVIGDDVWLASRVTVLAGVRIGNGAIVGAGALVNRDVEDYEIVGGVPVRHLRFRFTPEERRTHEAMLRAEPREGEYCPPIK